MPFGLTCSTSIFQREMENLFKNMDFVSVFVDDIVVSGRTNEEHIQNLEKVSKKLKEANLTVNKDKCSFFQEEIEYLGYTLTKEGLKKTKDKVKAIVAAPQPSNVTEVRSFIGLVNYYHKFIPNAAEILSPIYELLRAGKKFKWSWDCQQAFKKIKEIIASDICIVHFDPSLPIIVTADASQNGIAGTLSHIIDGQERTVACVSRTLQPSEKNMSTVMKEALAIYFTVNKFYYYLCNINFTLRSDHKPLMAIFGEHRGIPQMSASKLVRWAVFLSTFRYKIEYIKGTNNVVADYMSRASLPEKNNRRSTEEVAEKATYINFTETSDDWPIDNDKVREETKKDPDLALVMKYVKQDKWPNKVSENLKAYFCRKSELYVDHDVLMWGHRIIIPSTLRRDTIKLLHSDHPGISRCKSLARSMVYWPGIDKDLENFVKGCMPCLRTRQDPPRIKDTKWPETKEVMERMHIDFCEIKNKECLVMVDAYSKWVEICIMGTTTAEKTVERLREMFARFGLPKTLVSDNGPPFAARYLEIFLKKNGIKHTTSPPFHPMSNGAAENSVKHFKRKMKAALNDPNNRGVPLSTLVQRFLLTNRNTPHATTGRNPAELMMNRKLRTRITLLAERSLEEVRTHLTEESSKYRNFSEGDLIMARDYSSPNRKQWKEAIIERKIGRTTYLCRTIEGKLWKRHLNQIIGRTRGHPASEASSSNVGEYSYITLPVSHSVTEEPSSEAAGVPTVALHPSRSGGNLDLPSTADTEGLDRFTNSKFLSLGSNTAMSPRSTGEDRQPTTSKVIPSKTTSPTRRSGRSRKPPPYLVDFEIGKGGED